MCIAGVVGAILATTIHSQAAVKVAAVGFLALCVGCELVILKCGTVLLATIDKSLQNTSAVNSTLAAAPQAERGEGVDTKAGGRKGSGGHLDMVAARTKIKIAMAISLALAAPTIAMLIFAVASSFGTAAPLLFFGVPMGFAPSFWFMFNIQLHAGRSKPRVTPGVRSAGTSGHFQHQTSGYHVKSRVCVFSQHGKN